MRNDRLRYVQIFATDFGVQIGFHPGELAIAAHGRYVEIKSVGDRNTGAGVHLNLSERKQEWLCKHLRSATRQLNETIVQIFEDGRIEIKAYLSEKAIATCLPDTH